MLSGSNKSTQLGDVDAALVDQIKKQPSTHSVFEEISTEIESRYSVDVDVSGGCRVEAIALLDKCYGMYDDEKFDRLMQDCQNSVLTTIIRPFGLGKVLSEDKLGGNVTTIHNAKQGIRANKEEAYDRKSYTNSKNRNGESFAGGGKKSVGSQHTRSQMNSAGELTDVYTGKKEVAKNTSPDHKNSLSEFDRNGGYMLSDKDKADFATDGDNLGSTRRDINQSMRDLDKKEWAQKKQNGREVTNAEHYEIDEERLAEQHRQGQEVAEKHAPSTSKKVNFYGKAIAKTGASEAAKMGTQQAVGLLLEEFVRAVFFEIKDCWNNGFIEGTATDTFFDSLKERLFRIAEKVSAKWKDALDAFKDGAISGFFSNMITTLINLFKTTAGRTGRMIREGAMSLFRAIKMLLFPPEGMTFSVASHEASKLLLAGVTVAGGIMFEEFIEKSVLQVPVLGQFASVITPVLIGLVTGLASTFAVYWLDKMDFFGVEEERRADYVEERLDTMINESYENALQLAEYKEYPVLLHLEKGC